MDNPKIRISDRTNKLLRALIVEKENGQFRKGMLMEYVDRAILRYIAYEKGILVENQEQYAHAQNAKAIAKAKKSDNEIQTLKGKIINHFLERYDPVSAVEEDNLLSIIKAVTNKRDDRTVRNWLDLLLEKGHFRRLRGSKIEILRLEQQQQQQQPIDYRNEKIEGEILSAVIKAEEEEKQKEKEAKLVLAKYGDLR